MKQKSTKLRRLEQNRYSILQSTEMCYICGKMATDTHEIYAGSRRQMSMKNGFCVRLCRSCHTRITNDVKMDRMLKRICQQKYEETHTREQWLEIVGKNYLME